MRIIILLAKKMNIETDLLEWNDLPHFLTEAEQLAAYLKSLDYDELKTIWKCNDKIAALNYERLQTGWKCRAGCYIIKWTPCISFGTISFLMP